MTSYRSCSVTFQKKRVRNEVRTFCRVCGKKRNRVLNYDFYVNSFHDSGETYRRRRAEMMQETKELELNGVVGNKCQKEGAA